MAFDRNILLSFPSLTPLGTQIIIFFGEVSESYTNSGEKKKKRNKQQSVVIYFVDPIASLLLRSSLRLRLPLGRL